MAHNKTSGAMTADGAAFAPDTPTFWSRTDKQAWHIWFAWYPVRVGSAWVWFETVETRLMSRRGLPFWSFRDAEPKAIRA